MQTMNKRRHMAWTHQDVFSSLRRNFPLSEQKRLLHRTHPYPIPLPPTENMHGVSPKALTDTALAQTAPTIAQIELKRVWLVPLAARLAPIRSMAQTRAMDGCGSVNHTHTRTQDTDVCHNPRRLPPDVGRTTVNCSRVTRSCRTTLNGIAR